MSSVTHDHSLYDIGNLLNLTYKITEGKAKSGSTEIPDTLRLYFAGEKGTLCASLKGRRLV